MSFGFHKATVNKDLLKANTTFRYARQSALALPPMTKSQMRTLGQSVGQVNELELKCTFGRTQLTPHRFA